MTAGAMAGARGPTLVMDACPPDGTMGAADDVVSKVLDVVDASWVAEAMSRAMLSQGAGR